MYDDVVVVGIGIFDYDVVFGSFFVFVFGAEDVWEEIVIFFVFGILVLVYVVYEVDVLVVVVVFYGEVYMV